MPVSTESYTSWLAAAADGEQSLGERYLGESIAMLNADQVPEVVNKLYWEFRQAQGATGVDEVAESSQDDLRERYGEWSFDRVGMRIVELTHDGAVVQAERFCGAWPFASEKTAALLERLCEAPEQG